MKISKTLYFMLLNPIPLIVHLTWWYLFAAWLFVSGDPFMEMVWPRIVQITEAPASVGNYVTAASIFFNLIVEYVGWWILDAIPPFIISYREARGNLTGIAREQQVWMEWYRQQQETIAQGNTFGESPPSLEDRKVNSYFRTALKTLLSMARNPMPLIAHFVYWFSGFLFLSLILARIMRATEWEGPSVAPPLVIFAGAEVIDNIAALVLPFVVLALLSSYQETRGTVKGIAKVQQAWTEWHHRQQETKTQETHFDERPPLFDTAG